MLYRKIERLCLRYIVGEGLGSTLFRAGFLYKIGSQAACG
jgi:hypothetical protein